MPFSKIGYLERIFLDGCDFNQLTKPEKAEKWWCDKPMKGDLVPKNTKCFLVCLDGYRVESGK